ncbi:hypothetical protein EX30DRAFT_375788 [Ascodesmis nigricans]|uniref:Uncharacterized protein n=1 Tax=Ascodesmis nigricans TaxID=341454 RepID=A0A4S2MNR5_9PEZI|nr:hypothetical protein EX30DRAFT_375788 [Ascodesmis nigricans]
MAQGLKKTEIQNILNYVDDCAWITPYVDIKRARAELAESLNRVKRSVQEYGLSLEDAKTEVLFFDNARRADPEEWWRHAHSAPLYMAASYGGTASPRRSSEWCLHNPIVSRTHLLKDCPRFEHARPSLRHSLSTAQILGDRQKPNRASSEVYRENASGT